MPGQRSLGWASTLGPRLLRLPGVDAAASLLTAERFAVQGISMGPGFASGDHLLASPRPYRRASPRRGDVVVAWEPGQAASRCLKRIIGLPGERVTCEDGCVSINGLPLVEPYVAKAALPEGIVQEWLLGGDEFVVLGDRRDNSRDSRAFGPLKGELVVGKVWLCYWPPRRWRRIPPLRYG